ncbi:protein LOW PSII ACCUMULATION 2 [Cucumis melo var. makuwa]|uniref:Protein LOW PSII ACCUMULATION 2 n=1 Tax=Cucumis melo var. makuwa TaxID=1194695 RepID=A0A5A7VJY0_CUCMM|nr:protein LOW PSII ACCUMULATION 2 [Cucumis melo var. makuwa]TYK23688.1 protein LOW PSII ACCUMULATION 2 [Cucumis melo var. makuwa]
MALQILHHSPSSFTKKPYHLPNPSLHFSSKPKFIIKSQNPSESEKPISKIVDDAPIATSSKPYTSSSQGFGSSSPQSTSTSKSTPKSVKQKGKRQRASIIRRSPVEKPVFVGEVDEQVAKEQSRNESYFLLTWLGLGVVILVEGIVLAASGFLPEEWDRLFVKYLYPSFTPTVSLFVAGTVAYGVLKYLQNEKIKDEKS